MNVLIVDPSRTFHHLVAEVFGDIGVRSLAVTSVAAATEVLTSQPIGYVCSSLHLQDGTGLDLCREVRKLPDHTYTPFLLITAEPPAELREAAFRVGVTDIFGKTELHALAIFLQRLCRQYERTSGNVLVVEDSVAQSDYYASALEAVGLSVDKVGDGRAALELIGQWAYDLVVMDLVLPGEFSGVALANQIRRLPGEVGDVPILALTAFDQSGRRVELFYLGVNDYVSKPVSAEELVARARSLIHSARALREVRAQYRTVRSENAVRLSHDPMTGLYNRWHFESLLTDRGGAGAEGLSLAFLDVLCLGRVNEACGREAGDALLRETANRLGEAFAEDACAYLGGARFGLLIRGDGAEEKLAAFIAGQEAKHFSWEGTLFHWQGCAGVLAPLAADDSLAEAMGKADAACRAAGQGEVRVVAYQPDNEAGLAHRRRRETAAPLLDALESRDFLLFHQLILPRRAGLDAGCEVLIRLRGGDGAPLPPALFLPAAELYGIAPRMDRWVVSAVCAWLGGGRFPYGFASINLSALTLTDAAFTDFLDGEIARHRVRPDVLMFEITEAAALADVARAARFMAELRGLGCRVALDNFGAALTSSARLGELPLDLLKLDGRFVRGLPGDALNLAVVRSARDIANAAGLALAAKCVESAEQKELLEALGLDYLQGFALDHPAPLAEIAGSGEEGDG